MKTAVARPRFAEGKRSPISDAAAGAQTASPDPTPSRAAKRQAKLVVETGERGHRAPQRAPAPRSQVRRVLSASGRGQADHGVEQRERGADPADLGVAQPPFAAQRLHDGAENVASKKFSAFSRKRTKSASRAGAASVTYPTRSAHPRQW
jgi:hypothetical protein